MTIVIINWLELIKINGDYRAKVSTSIAGDHCLIETIVEKGSVRQTSQRVIKSKLFDLLFKVLALSDVLYKAMPQGRTITFTLWLRMSMQPTNGLARQIDSIVLHPRSEGLL